MAKQKRIIIRVMWDRKNMRWRTSAKPAVISSSHDELKEDAVLYGRAMGRYLASIGHTAQLLIYTKAGRIMRGRNGEASYGVDSRAPG